MTKRSSSFVFRFRRFPIAFLLAAALLWQSLAAQRAPAAPSVYPGAAWQRIAQPETVGYSSPKLEKAREYARTLSTTGLMVVLSGQVLLEHGDLEQLSYLASVRKSILAMLYGNYVASGKISLDRTLEDLKIDDRAGLLPIERKATIDHLITARSGVYHPASNGGDNAADAPDRGSQKPGEYFLYNNWDFNAAGAIFERLSGKDIYDALQSDLAQPIRMQDFDRSRQRKGGNLERSQFPAYHIWLSTRDMARLGYLMLRHGSWQGRQVIPRDWAEKIVSVVTPVGETNPPRMREWGFGYGYMWWIWDGTSNAGPFNGAYSARGAYGQYITVLPALDLVIAHKTAVPPQRSVNWLEYQGILDRVVAARCDGDCG